MLILKGIEQLEKAIAKAKKIRPRVEFDHFGRYSAFPVQKVITQLFAAKTNAAIKRLLALARARSAVLSAITAAAALSLHIGLARRQQTA